MAIACFTTRGMAAAATTSGASSCFVTLLVDSFVGPPGLQALKGWQGRYLSAERRGMSDSEIPERQTGSGALEVKGSLLVIVVER